MCWSCDAVKWSCKIWNQTYLDLISRIPFLWAYDLGNVIDLSQKKVVRKYKWHAKEGTLVLKLNSFWNKTQFFSKSKSFFSPLEMLYISAWKGCWAKNQSFVQQLWLFSMNNLVENRIFWGGRHSRTKVWLWKELAHGLVHSMCSNVRHNDLLFKRSMSKRSKHLNLNIFLLYYLLYVLTYVLPCSKKRFNATWCVCI